MYRTQFDRDEIPNEMLEYFQEVEVMCGAPWRRVTKREGGRAPANQAAHKQAQVQEGGVGSSTLCGKAAHRDTLGWRPSCNCPGLDGDAPWPDMTMHPDGDANWPTAPCVVMDPFSGSGTSGRCASRHNRDYIGIDLCAAYHADLATARLEVQPLLMGLGE